MSSPFLSPQRRVVLATWVSMVGAVLPCPVGASEPDGPGVFAIASAPAFSGYRAPLASFLKTAGARRVNTVCILGEEAPDGTRSAWVIWREGHKMILWDGGREPLASSRRILDLRRDVVASDADVKASTYLVTRDWVASKKCLCERSGTRLRITRAELE